MPAVGRRRWRRDRPQIATVIEGIRHIPQEMAQYIMYFVGIASHSGTALS